MLTDRPQPAAAPSKATTGHSVPGSIWRLATAGIAAGMALLAALSTALLSMTDQGGRAQAQHEALSQLSDALREPIDELELLHGQLAEPLAAAETEVDAARFGDLIDALPASILPEPVMQRMAAVRGLLDTAEEQLAQCYEWRLEEQHAKRKRANARTATEVSIATMRAAVEEQQRMASDQRTALIDGLDRWFDRYNSWRPHEALGNLTPDHVYDPSLRTVQGDLKQQDTAA